jgi:hypothetical protein
MKIGMNLEARKQRTAISPLITSGFAMMRWLRLPAHRRLEWRCFSGKE